MPAPVIPGQPPCVQTLHLQPCRCSPEGSRASSATSSHRSKGLVASPGCQNMFWIKELVSEAALQEMLQVMVTLNAGPGSGTKGLPIPVGAGSQAPGPARRRRGGDLHFQSYSSRSESCKQTQKRCTSTNSSKAKAFERAQRSR